MNKYLETIKDKSIAIIGSGKTGLSGAKYLINKAKNIKFFDDAKKVSQEVSKFMSQNNVELSKINEKILDFDIIFLSPGVPRSLEIIQKAVKLEIDIVNDIELLYRIKPSSKIVAITGSNGKTTTTYLTGEIFSKKYKTAVAGNIGTPILDVIDQNIEVFILELSSFQIESLTEFSPTIATILNITPDHLDRYNSMEHYTETKRDICKNIKEDGLAILNNNDVLLRDLEVNSNIKYFDSNSKNSDIYIANNKIIFNKNYITLSEIFIKGNHNYENIMSAILMADHFNISFDIIKKVVCEFSGVEHRLEFVKEINGISFYNDSKATNPDSVISALKSFDNPIIWLAGGRSKNTPFDNIIKLAKTQVEFAIFFGESREEFAKAFEGIIKYIVVEDLEEAVTKANLFASNREIQITPLHEELKKIIVLSPGCTSFDAYSSYTKRGKHFKNLVEKINESE